MSDSVNLFIIAGAWSLVAIAIVRLIPNWPARIAAFALLVGIPFWELPYGYYNFQQLCNNEGKLRLSQSIGPQESICIENLDGGMLAALMQAGFSRIEVTGKSDDSRRDAASGKVFRTKSSEIKSQYCIVYQSNIEVPWRILRDDMLIVRASDQRVIGRQSQFLWFGMWWQDRARPVLGRGGFCNDGSQRPLRSIRTGAV